MSLQRFKNAARGKECAIRSVRGDRDSVMVTVAAGGYMWLLQFLEVADMRLDLIPSRRVEVASKHILLDAAIGPHATLSFAGEPENPIRLANDLDKAHRAIAQEFFPLPKLLARRGRVTGPLRLLKAYAPVLKRHGYEVALKEQQGGRYRVGGSWTSKRPDFVVLAIGTAYIVGRCNSVERVRT